MISVDDNAFLLHLTLHLLFASPASESLTAKVRRNTPIKSPPPGESAFAVLWAFSTSTRVPDISQVLGLVSTLVAGRQLSFQRSKTIQRTRGRGAPVPSLSTTTKIDLGNASIPAARTARPIERHQAGRETLDNITRRELRGLRVLLGEQISGLFCLLPAG